MVSMAFFVKITDNLIYNKEFLNFKSIIKSMTKKKLIKIINTITINYPGQQIKIGIQWLMML